jgi:hypothetical protein
MKFQNDLYVRFSVYNLCAPSFASRIAKSKKHVSHLESAASSTVHL